MTVRTPVRTDALRAALRRLTGDEKHQASAHSTVDVLSVLHDRVLDVSPDRFTVNGWTSSIIDGRSHEAIERGLRAHAPGRPHVVVARVETRWLERPGSQASPKGT